MSGSGYAQIKGQRSQMAKGFHLIAVSCWIGGGIALILLYFLKKGVTDGNVLYGINQNLHHVDMGVVVYPGAFGCLITGLIFSSFSNWGFFKHKWILLKWILTIAAIWFGSTYLGPWERALVSISGKLGMGALTSQEYLPYEQMHVIFSAVQILLLMTIIFISIFKPWKAIRSRNQAAMESGGS